MADLLTRLRALSRLELVIKLSLLLLVLNTNEDPPLFVLALVSCVVALLRPGIARHPAFWLVAFAVIGGRQLSDWEGIDDHVVVTTYWCGALGLALLARETERVLALSARLLVAGVFSFAFGWKVLSGEFVDGTFFRYSLLIDDRFEVIANTVGGTEAASFDADLDAIRAIRADPREDEVVVLEEGPRNDALATAMTWDAILLEGAIAAVFLAPLRGRALVLRHAAILAFALTTYVVIPVGGFGCLLVVLGCAQAQAERLRTLYAGVFLALLVWSALWPALFL